VADDGSVRCDAVDTGVNGNIQILEQKRAVLAHALRLVGMGHGDAIAGGIEGLLGLHLTILLIVAVGISGVLSKRRRSRHVDE
jgi:hypothetical protein